jgi:hypothetical protein
VARAPQVRRPPRNPTPAGMEGVRPGSAAAVAAGYRPPRPSRTTPGYIGQAGTGNPYAGFTPPATTTIPAPTPAPTPEVAPTPTVAAPPPQNAAWWASQITANPAYMTQAPVLEAQREGIGREYGFTIARDAQGRPLYKTAAGATGITQQFDDQGNIVYKDPTGQKYTPEQLQLDIQRIQPGGSGYLTGRFGAAEAGSKQRQFGIGDVAAQAGAGRSGMRELARSQETAALQSALAGLTSSAGGALSGIDQQFAELYRDIYKDLAEKAGEFAPSAPAETPAPSVTTGPQTAPASTGQPVAAGVPVPQRPLPQARTIEIAGQSVAFPKGINLSGVDVDGIGRRIASNVRAAGGVGKLRNGQRVGEFRAGDKGYRVFYRNGKFVIELIG